MDAGLEPLWRAARRRAGPALRLRLAFRAGADLVQALALYRAQFRPSRFLDKPYVMLGLNVVAAERMRGEASVHLAAAGFRQSAHRQSGPVAAAGGRHDRLLSADPRIEAMLASVLAVAQVGSPETVKAGIEAFIAKHQPDELMVTGQIYDHAGAAALLRNPRADFDYAQDERPRSASEPTPA